jgi:hypothetical protein
MKQIVDTIKKNLIDILETCLSKGHYVMMRRNLESHKERYPVVYEKYSKRLEEALAVEQRES